MRHETQSANTKDWLESTRGTIILAYVDPQTHGFSAIAKMPFPVQDIEEIIGATAGEHNRVATENGGD